MADCALGLTLTLRPQNIQLVPELKPGDHIHTPIGYWNDSRYVKKQHLRIWG